MHDNTDAASKIFTDITDAIDQLDPHVSFSEVQPCWRDVIVALSDGMAHGGSAYGDPTDVFVQVSGADLIELK
ncbi:hypothetical protein AB0C34_23755 [Nocardia sp. NPDC049220]|uniref:hypothetical protein n=1 Tax=Nocardia sp. NPDC049220 TaxID=3155273 RepID=UPI0033D9E156